MRSFFSVLAAPKRPKPLTRAPDNASEAVPLKAESARAFDRAAKLIESDDNLESINAMLATVACVLAVSILLALWGLLHIAGL